MRIFFLLFIAVLLFSCNEPVKKTTADPTGKWENPLPWDNNFITLTFRPDSVMLFKAKKLFCPGTKYFVAVGKWRMQNDSMVVMKKFTDGRKYELKDIFPELTHLGSDSVNVIGLDMEARFIVTKDTLYDVELNGTKSKTRHYLRKK
jgi:hypothetical protein